MTTNSSTTDIKRLHELIDRYFDATATDAEERELRSALAFTTFSSDKIDEARAVTGYFAVSRKPASAKSRHRGQWLRAAAAIAVAAVCGAALLTFNSSDEIGNQCVAYVGQTAITDSREVLAMMHSDLALIGEASQSVQSDVANQLSTLFNSSLQ